MLSGRTGSSKFLFLTTLIDLLVQVVFLFLVIYFITEAKIYDLQSHTGQTVEQIKESWRQLVNIDSVKSVLASRDQEIARLNERYSTVKEEYERLTGRGGIDKPPCWRTASGQPEYLLKIRIREDGLFVSRAWPEERAIEVLSHGLDETDLDRVLSVKEFNSRFRPFAHHQDFQMCTHFVVVADESYSKLAYTRHLNAIEELFYKRHVKG